MRIAISGVQNTGKSTLLKLFKDHPSYEKYTFIEEPIRKLLKEKKITTINEKFDSNSQNLIFNEHILNITHHTDFVSDRCLLDAFVYSCYNREQIPDNIFSNYSSIFEKNINDYDVIIYLPFEKQTIKLTDDGVRNIDGTYIERLEEIFIQTIRAYRIPVLYKHRNSDISDLFRELSYIQGMLI